MRKDEGRGWRITSESEPQRRFNFAKKKRDRERERGRDLSRLDANDRVPLIARTHPRARRVEKRIGEKATGRLRRSSSEFALPAFHSLCGYRDRAIVFERTR